MLSPNERTAFIAALQTRSLIHAVDVCSTENLDLAHMPAIAAAIREAALKAHDDAADRIAAEAERKAAFWNAPAPRRGQFHAVDPFCDCSACTRHYEKAAVAAAGGYRID